MYWLFDDAENDEIIRDINVSKKNHSNDGLYIYEIKNDEIKEIKIIKINQADYRFFIFLKNEIIMKYYDNYKTKILKLDKNNLEIINNLKVIDDNLSYWDISTFNGEFLLVVIWKKDQPVKIRIYGIKTFNKEYEWKVKKNFLILIIMEIIGICH